ncbi:hypothetical protein AC93_4608 [Escherichia coli 2-005-03_S4_C2]|jgi:hypothetical protein|uniref:Uncharacterized protein n=2 Tax=Escherichia coli TaxID=562 RepID=A0A376VWQ3_ECOLX|nr:hypothetical protein AD23_4762 [Escherichia coli 2-005-03_S4_C3]EZJ47479.1 hypothetical protein AC93_4608 [Escherichia coli 2-005-03_S4_C2]CAR10990.1 hypothetical protein ECED1_5035 [Escherichia coli ED1a]STC74010.1 Uncharacterised protein [Escherichia coli]STJ16216.1 Uncharacterised protein [Escherichia coli]
MGADVTEFSVQGKSGTCRQFSDLFNREIIFRENLIWLRWGASFRARP